VTSEPIHAIFAALLALPAETEWVEFKEAKDTNHRNTIDAAHELTVEGKRVLMLEIPSAPTGIPTEWRGVPFGRHNDSTQPLTVDQIDRIRRQHALTDWSAEVVADATIDDLDPAAIQAAREQFKKKNLHLDADVDRWDTVTFLNKTKLFVEIGKMKNHKQLLN
jgi:ATP-dependent DNA helicase RecG